MGKTIEKNIITYYYYYIPYNVCMLLLLLLCLSVWKYVKNKKNIVRILLYVILYYYCIYNNRKRKKKNIRINYGDTVKAYRKLGGRFAILLFYGYPNGNNEWPIILYLFNKNGMVTIILLWSRIENIIAVLVLVSIGSFYSKIEIRFDFIFFEILFVMIF